ncbi:MAG: hypothetical protein ACKO4Q_16225 [Planctomycetota bacterium]
MAEGRSCCLRAETKKKVVLDQVKANLESMKNIDIQRVTSVSYLASLKRDGTVVVPLENVPEDDLGPDIWLGSDIVG